MFSAPTPDSNDTSSIWCLTSLVGEEPELVLISKWRCPMKLHKFPKNTQIISRHQRYCSKNTTQVMSGGFLMFPKIVSETVICFTKASIYLTLMDFLCKHRLSDSVVALRDRMLNPWQELDHPKLKDRSIFTS